MGILKSRAHGWFGNYSSWEQAEKNSEGYNKKNILHKVKEALLKVKQGEAAYERDSVVFEKLEYVDHLLTAFQSTIRKNQLNIIDFGGSLGSLYFQYRTLLKGLNICWTVVEQKNFVECGSKFFSSHELRFETTIESALKQNNSNTLLLGSVLTYLANPDKWMEQFINYGFEYIIIDRTAFLQADQARITVQVVPEAVYKASYPCWFLVEGDFKKKLKEKYDLIDEFDSPFSHPVTLEDGVRAYWKGFVFRRKNHVNER